MKKGFSILEIIVGIIFIGMISEIMVGISTIQKSNTITNINVNNHILLDSEIEQAKGNCCYLGFQSCATRGGVGDDNFCVIEYDSDNLNYFKKEDDGTISNLTNMIPNKVKTTCTKKADGFYDINVELTTIKDVLKGSAIVNKCYEKI